MTESLQLAKLQKETQKSKLYIKIDLNDNKGQGQVFFKEKPQKMDKLLFPQTFF